MTPGRKPRARSPEQSDEIETLVRVQGQLSPAAPARAEWSVLRRRGRSGAAGADGTSGHAEDAGRCTTSGGVVHRVRCTCALVRVKGWWCQAPPLKKGGKRPSPNLGRPSQGEVLISGLDQAFMKAQLHEAGKQSPSRVPSPSLPTALAATARGAFPRASQDKRRVNNPCTKFWVRNLASLPTAFALSGKKRRVLTTEPRAFAFAGACWRRLRVGGFHLGPSTATRTMR